MKDDSEFFKMLTGDKLEGIKELVDESLKRGNPEVDIDLIKQFRDENFFESVRALFEINIPTSVSKDKRLIKRLRNAKAPSARPESKGA
jgi:hypothetical protein